MKAFADLYTALDETTKTNEKVDALARYFASAPPDDAAWALYFLIGRRPRQVVPSARLRQWVEEVAGLPEWLFSESYDAVGDFAETLALLLPDDEGRRTKDESLMQNPSSFVGGHSSEDSLRYWIEEQLLPLRGADEAAQREIVLRAWTELDRVERFIWNKLITGGFRVGVSQLLVTRALAKVSGVEAGVIAHRLMGDWEPSAPFYERLLSPDTQDAETSQPYPFCLAHPLEGDPADLGPIDEWQAEWKWDGIRSQLIHRNGQVFIWSRGEELVTDRYPELAEAGALLPPGTVIDGEILPWKDGGVLPFAQLQRRIGRKTVGKKLLNEIPVVIMAYDLLELDGRDVRQEPLSWRRAELEKVINSFNHRDTEKTKNNNLRDLRASVVQKILLSPIVQAASWEELAATREQSRELNAEGLMLKRRSSAYRVGRVRGDWWKWKVDPYTIDAVLIYAQRGSGKRASLYTDYTFAVWDDGQLVPFTKAYSGLTDAEIRKVDAFIRRNTVEKFGPVRTVTPELVFELGFEGIQRSNRHKSGIAVRFPRILRWRTDKPIAEADSLDTIKAMLPKEA
ncbi:MAG TPA: ATP-dependent DNA ligase [Roseiflexaceae bacterium]|jgi:DNA ligase-1|nr:ATP-dependent DNA ligase [Roseiflexaceae bacterium]